VDQTTETPASKTEERLAFFLSRGEKILLLNSGLITIAFFSLNAIGNHVSAKNLVDYSSFKWFAAFQILSICAIFLFLPFCTLAYYKSKFSRSYPKQVEESSLKDRNKNTMVWIIPLGISFLFSVASFWYLSDFIANNKDALFVSLPSSTLAAPPNAPIRNARSSAQSPSPTPAPITPTEQQDKSCSVQVQVKASAGK